MKLLVALLAVAIAHDQPLDTVHTVDTVDTGVLRFLIKGPCSPQILEEFNDLAVICNKYSRHSAKGMKWGTAKWDRIPGTAAVAGELPYAGATNDAAGQALFYSQVEVKHIRLNHVTVAIECCDALLNNSPAGTVGTATGVTTSYAATTLGGSSLTSGSVTIDNVEAGYGWYPCHDLMNSLFNTNQLPTSQELYADSQLGSAATSNPDPTTNSNAGAATRL